MNSNLNLILKYIAGAALDGVWAALVFTGHADASQFVYAIGGQVAALFGYQAVTGLQAVQKGAAPAPLPIIPASRDTA